MFQARRFEIDGEAASPWDRRERLWSHLVRAWSRLQPQHDEIWDECLPHAAETVSAFAHNSLDLTWKLIARFFTGLVRLCRDRGVVLPVLFGPETGKLFHGLQDSRDSRLSLLKALADVEETCLSSIDAFTLLQSTSILPRKPREGRDGR